MGSKPGMYERMDGLQGIEKVEEHLKWLKETYKDPKEQGWISTIAPHLSIVSHSQPSPSDGAPAPTRVTFRFTPQPCHGNGVTGVHGGCTATLFDHCTSLALLLLAPSPSARAGSWRSLGVTRTLAVTYVRPMPVGAPVDVECEVVHAGARLAVLRGVARAAAAAAAAAAAGGEEGEGEGSKGPVLAICEHGKVSTDPPAGGKL